MEARLLEQIRTVMKDAVGANISYAYDDLIFPDHQGFLMQFDDTDSNNYFCHLHRDCQQPEKDRLLMSLRTACKLHNCTLTPKGAFYLEQQDEEVKIHFV